VGYVAQDTTLFDGTIAETSGTGGSRASTPRAEAQALTRKARSATA